MRFAVGAVCGLLGLAAGTVVSTLLLTMFHDFLQEAIVGIAALVSGAWCADQALEYMDRNYPKKPPT